MAFLKVYCKKRGLLWAMGAGQGLSFDDTRIIRAGSPGGRVIQTKNASLAEAPSTMPWPGMTRSTNTRCLQRISVLPFAPSLLSLWWKAWPISFSRYSSSILLLGSE